MSDDKVIFLAFKNEKVNPSGRDFLACGHCRNKTYILEWHGDSKFPLCQCAACGMHIGLVGWAEQS